MSPDLVERIGPAHGDHWWHASLLAFTRQDQSRFDEAGALAEQALAAEPSSGHAVHAQTHVMYETGRHETGRAWLDHWVSGSGPGGDAARGCRPGPPPDRRLGGAARRDRRSPAARTRPLRSTRARRPFPLDTWRRETLTERPA